MLVSGGTGAGKTTTLNVISGFIPDDERIITIEDAAELKLRQRHVLSLETRPANVEGRGQIVVRDLVISSLRMRPDRLVVGECRGGEALDMLQAMSTGHDGSLTTLHASSTHEAISRLETMVLMAGTELPTAAIRGQIGSAIDLIVQQGRLRDGSRRILSISEVIGVENGEVQIQELFRFEQSGVDAEGRVLGQHVACGRVPRRTADILASGEDLDMHIFVAPDRPSGPDHPRRRLADWVPETGAAPLPLAAADRRRRSDWLPERRAPDGHGAQAQGELRGSEPRPRFRRGRPASRSTLHRLGRPAPASGRASRARTLTWPCQLSSSRAKQTSMRRPRGRCPASPGLPKAIASTSPRPPSRSDTLRCWPSLPKVWVLTTSQPRIASSGLGLPIPQGSTISSWPQSSGVASRQAISLSTWKTRSRRRSPACSAQAAETSSRKPSRSSARRLNPAAAAWPP